MSFFSKKISILKIISKVHFGAGSPPVRVYADDVERFFESPVWLALQKNICNTLEDVYRAERTTGIPHDVFVHAQAAKKILEYLLESKRILMADAHYWETNGQPKSKEDHQNEAQLRAKLEQ